MPRSVGDGDTGRHLGAVLEHVASVEHEVGDRFPRCPDPEDPHASRGWSTPKLILPKRGVWERHADANWFCRGYQFRTLLQLTTPATGPAVVARPPGVTPTRGGNRAGRRPTVVLDNLGRPAAAAKPRPSWLSRPPSSRHQPLAAGRRLTVDPRLLPTLSSSPESRRAPPLRGPRQPRRRRRPLCQRVRGAPWSTLSAAARAAAAGAVGSTPGRCAGPATRREPATELAWFRGRPAGSPRSDATHRGSADASGSRPAGRAAGPGEAEQPR
jgi:hypothetical protein